MKTFLIIFLTMISLNVYAYTHVYSVAGIDDDGDVMEGTIYENISDDGVNGELTDQNGDIHSFQGQWDGLGQIKGETDDGDAVVLRVK